MDLGLEPPRYQKLAMSIAERIGSGAYPVGQLMPPEEQLCREFGLSRFTVRAALKHLQDAGMISRRNGIGTEVIARAPASGFTHTIGSVEQVNQYARDTRLTGHKTAMVTADAALAAELGCAPGQKLLRIDALRVPAEPPRADPIAWTRIHLIEEYAAIRDELKTMSDAIGARIEVRFGERISAITQTVSAVLLEAERAARLRVPNGSAGLRVDRRYLGRNGLPFEYVTSLHPAGRFVLSMRLDRRGA